MRIFRSMALVAAFAAAVPVAAQEHVLQLGTGNTAPQSESEDRDYADAHDALLLDASGSVDDAEIISIFDGVREYYTSDDAQVLYDTGLCTAVTVIFYGDRPSVKPTYIICNREDAERFVAENVDLTHISAVRASVGSTATYLHYAMEEAINVFDHNTVEAARKRVVVVSDERGGVHAVINKLALSLSFKYGATISGVAIGTSRQDVQKFFVQSVITPPESIYMEPQYDGSLLERNIAQGKAFMAAHSADVKAQLQLALTLGGA